MASTHPSDVSPRIDLPEMLAAVDIGTNSVHMVIARVSGRSHFEVVTRHKEVVRLGSGADDMRLLTDDAIDRGIAALARCRQMADSFGAELTAVATSAVREADNAAVFLDRARREAGVEVDVISGMEEARLIHLGMLQSLPIYDQRVLLCDIGGGSTELLLGEGEDVLAARSFKLGAIRMTERFFPGGDVSPDGVTACRRHVAEALTLFRRETTAVEFSSFAVTSGTAECLVRMAILRRGDGPPRTMNGATITRAELSAVVAEVVGAPDADARRGLRGMEESRADIIVGGAIVLDVVAEKFRADTLTFSDAALREGVLLDALQRLTGDDLSHLSELRRRSALHLLEMCDDDPAHAVKVAELAESLFDGLRGILGVRAEAGELLDAAALLANVGLFVSHSRHHQHSYYVIRNSEHLAGFTDHEIELIAQIARYHRKSAPTDRHPAFADLSQTDQHLVRALAGILRVAIGLDRGHAGRVGSVAVEVDDGGVTVEIVPAEDAGDAELEVHAAAARTGLIESVLGLSMTVMAATKPAR